MSRAILSLLSAVAVAQAGTIPPQTITGAAAAAGATTFSAFVECTGNADLVNGLIGATVWVPSNQGFTEFLARTAVTDPCTLSQPAAFQILEYHVIPEELLSNDFQYQFKLSPPTINGARLVLDGVGFVNQARIDQYDLRAGTNVLHIINSVLISPTIWASSPLVKAFNPLDTSTFFELLECSGLSLGATQTLIVPTNAALAGVDCNTFPQAVLADILRYHIIPGEALYTWKVPEYGQFTTALNGNNVLHSSPFFGYGENYAKLVNFGFNIPHNGAATTLIHTVDKLIGSPDPVVQTITAASFPLSSDLTIVAGALACTGLTNVIDTLGPVTFMLPNNAAFIAANYPNPCDQIPLDDLRDILLYHVVNGASIYSFQMTSGTGPATMQGESWTITRVAPGFILLNELNTGTPTVIHADILVNPNANKPTGVFHVINKVLLPICEGICGKNAVCDNEAGQCQANCDSECCTPGGCDDQGIQSCVCKIDPWCCNPNQPERWDSQCAEEAQMLCGLKCA